LQFFESAAAYELFSLFSPLRVLAVFLPLFLFQLVLFISLVNESWENKNYPCPEKKRIVSESVRKEAIQWLSFIVHSSTIELRNSGDWTVLVHKSKSNFVFASSRSARFLPPVAQSIKLRDERRLSRKDKFENKFS
jgi:hypothetical protein